MARKPAFAKKTKKSTNSNNGNSAPHFSKFEDYFDYGVKRETDGERFAQSDTKKSTNAFNDALNCYKTAIKIYNENPGFYSGDISVYQNIVYNYLRVKYDLLSEFKYVAGDVDITKFIPESDINKELKESLFQDNKPTLDELRNEYESYSQTLQTDINTWDFFFNYLAYLSSYLEWIFELENANIKDAMIIVQRQIEIFDKLKESSQIVFNDTYTNHQNFDDPVLAQNMALQKDTMFLPNQYNQNVVNTMSKLDINSLLEMETLVLKSIASIVEITYTTINIKNETIDVYYEVLKTLETYSQHIIQNSLVSSTVLSNVEIQEEINKDIYKETEETIYFTNTLMGFSNPENIKQYVIEVANDLDNINVESKPVVVELLKSVLEILSPIKIIRESIKNNHKNETKVITSALGDLEMFYQILNMVVKLDRQVIMSSNEKIKLGKVSTNNVGSEYCNLAELFLEVADIELQRSYWKQIESKSEESAASYDLRKSYLKNAYSFVVNDLGSKETKKDRYYRLYLKEVIEEMINE